MQSLSILIQPSQSDAFQPEDAIALAKSLGRYPEVDRDAQTGEVVLKFFSENLPLLWSQLVKGMFNDEELGEWLQSVSIVVCDPVDGGRDELLLYHFDEDEELDEF